MSKNEFRQRALRSRRSLPRQEIGSLSELVKGRLLGLPEFASARTIASYVAKSDEVQTAGIIEAALAGGKTVLVPRSDPVSSELIFSEIDSLSELSPGHFGVLEPPATARPVPLDQSDIVLVPVVAWDDSGRRLGYGKGYFDRALRMNLGPLKIGLALESQRFGEVPHSSTDVPLNAMVTEERILRFGGRGG